MQRCVACGGSTARWDRWCDNSNGNGNGNGYGNGIANGNGNSTATVAVTVTVTVTVTVAVYQVWARCSAHSLWRGAAGALSD
jgi:hypothetical protein